HGVLSKSDDVEHIPLALRAAMQAQMYVSPTMQAIQKASRELQGPSSRDAFWIACIVGETYICACMAARRASGMCSTSSDLLNTPCTPVATIPARMAGLSSIVRTTMRNAG